MQILFGRHKGRRLRTPPDERIRPTTGRMRDWLGNILRDHVPGCQVLDLFAGSGGLGLLAISMGASHATFVDKSPTAMRLVKENLRILGEEDAGTPVKADVEAFLKHTGGRRWRLVFVDPPYDSTDYARLMKALAGADMLSPGGLVVVEHPGHVKPVADGLTLVRTKAFGRSTISLFSGEAESGDGSPHPH